MNLFKFNGTNGVEHFVNPLKITRVTFTPEQTITSVPLPPLPGEEAAEPVITVLPPSLTIHLDDQFTIQVADDKEDLLDRLDKLD